MEWYYPLVRHHLQHIHPHLWAFFKTFRKWLVSLFLASVFFFATLFELEISARARAASPPPLKDHYLMLVNTAMARQMDAQKLAQFDRSPYEGLAVSFSDAYDVSPVPTPASMELQIAGWKKFTGKHIWPWVYLNRMIGANNAEGNELTQVPYFQKFQGLDLDGTAGAQNDFLENWRNALRVARKISVPGIVFDLEFYNNYKADDISDLARMTSMSREETVQALKNLGARMAETASAEYPHATIWVLFTGFTRPDYRIIDGQPHFLAGTYIVEGLLDEIQQHQLALHVLSGGELGLGYCHNSIDDLRQAIQKRAQIYAPLLQKYKGILELSGTMTLWSDRSAKKNWVAEEACGNSSAATLEDLIPYMELLFRSYRYNWIYGSPNGGYLALNSAIAPRFDAAIVRAKALAIASETAIHPDP
ncbi:MAG TPA: hypothetical protein VG272_11620 [Candidatus Acidoferrales bacterium]|nr:hypothetical protein [Candidatus Acidoferrales bacterium]